MTHMAHFYLITGCSGGGKSTLLSALAREGHRVIEEPGLRIVCAERDVGGTVLPWLDMTAFARAAVAMALADLNTAAGWRGPVFFDRGLIDAAVALEHASSVPLRETLGPQSPYADPVFLAPPWPEIYVSDTDRPHGFDDAVAEFERLEAALARLHHKTVNLPKVSVPDRVGFVLDHLPTQY